MAVGWSTVRACTRGKSYAQDQVMISCFFSAFIYMLYCLQNTYTFSYFAVAPKISTNFCKMSVSLESGMLILDICSMSVRY